MRYSVFYGAIAVAMLFTGAAYAGETLDRVEKTKVLNNVLVNDYPPFSFIDKDNQLAGFDVDVAEAVAGRLGVKLINHTPGWETIVGGNWQGRWDISIGSTTPTTDRAEVLDFVAEYYEAPTVLVVNEDETNIKSVKDISGKRVGVGTGSSYEAYLDKTIEIPGAAKIEFPFEGVTKVPSDETVAFQNLSLGPGVRLDAVVANLATAQGYIETIGKLKVVGEALYAEPNWVTVDKGDPEWNAKVAETIEALRADGTLAKISNKWLGRDITAK